MTSLSKLAVNLTGRPHLITPGAAQEMMTAAIAGFTFAAAAVATAMPVRTEPVNTI